MSNPADTAEIGDVVAAKVSKTTGPEVPLPSEKELTREPSIAEVPATKPEYPAGHPMAGEENEGLHKVYPTREEMQTLRRVARPLNWITFSVAFVELCERFSYYGTTAVFVNFIQQPLPPGSTTGALVDGRSNVPGALGMGQQASTGLTLFNSFWSYIMPLAGAFMADQYWGRYRTIMFSIGAALIGHCILIVSAIPQVISNPNGAIGAFSIGLIIMGIGTGGFKSNISALIAEQYPDEQAHIKVLPDGERVIVDPAATTARIYLYFYLMINVGSLTGQISMVYAEREVGFWLSFLLPTIMFCFSPLVLYLCRNKYYLVPPTGSVYTQAYRLIRLACSKHWRGTFPLLKKNGTPFWDTVKPSTLGSDRPTWMTFDDEWVDEVARGLKACRVFLWYPLYWLAYNQMLNNLTSQAATMELNGVPNDIINNFNPLALIIFIPIFDHVLYPGLRKMGINFTPLKRITAGFFMAGAGMIVATVTQHYIYQKSACGKHANTCLTEQNLHSPISVWVQALTYILGGISEILASVTSLEYAFTKAPKNMRSLVQAVALFMNAFSSAIGQALVGLSEDPLLVWNYAVVAILAFVGGIGFWISNYKLDRQEDELNTLPTSRYEGTAAKGDEEARS
ncbi:PTR2-domain-containing protein [Aspergillus karnatakaensis]|uniref:putative MFS peptide transporter n=1 Tax=Aspergillus karnatakaensis TaxID=1810916 RepID=UPI003CCD3B81